jgi:ParB-like nuclease domain
MVVTDDVPIQRPTDSSFGILTDLVVSDEPQGYDLSMVRSIADDGLITAITVEPIGNGRFKVVDGRKRLAAIQILVRINKLVYDNLRGLLRPAKQVYTFIRCRFLRRPASRLKP